MIAKKNSIWKLKKAVFGCFFGIMAMFGLAAPLINSGLAFAEPTEVTTTEAPATNEAPANAPATNAPVANTPANAPAANASDNTTTTTENTSAEAGQTEIDRSLQKTNAPGSSCKDRLGELGWYICPETNKVAEAVDWLRQKTEEILVINPVEPEDGKPIFELWKYFRGVTNIVFIFVLLVVIYSQLTGLGISNYGIKKVLPKLIVTAILVNLSFYICALAVDASNIIGQSLKGLFDNIQYAVSGNIEASPEAIATLSKVFAALEGGVPLAIGAAFISFETGAIWMLIPVVLGAVVSVACALITIAMRQAVVALLIMISPLAIVAYILPNTEQWFKKWKQLFTRMLVFYPLFSLLYGASNLAGWAIIASAKDGFWLILGLAVQIFPLFFSWTLMKMSGTFLGTVNGKLHGLMSKPLAANRAWADSRRMHTKQKHLASRNTYTPSLKLMKFLSDRRVAREEETAEYAATVKLRGQSYGARRALNKHGIPTAEGEEAYEMQARRARYQFDVDRNKNNMNKGLGALESVKAKASLEQKIRLNSLDIENINASDALKMEAARGEKIDYNNAVGYHNRMENAVNSHFDELNWDNVDKDGNLKYKRHFDSQKSAAYKEALERYNAALNVMEGDPLDAQYAAAYAAQAYDTQQKIITSKFQKYFDLAPPTQDDMYRLREFSRPIQAPDGTLKWKTVDNIDAIIAGLRVINQRGDTDLVKSVVDDITNLDFGGLQLGTHASQALASFLMFEVKDNDPFLRRFGKYINLETANVYNENNRKEMNVSYDEYVKGYHTEPDGTIMYAKKDMKKLVEGTSLDNVERTAFQNLDDSLKKAYGFDPNDKTKEWDVAGWMKKREQLQTAFEPAFLSAGLKWLSGSEQMNSGVKFWMGYDAKQVKDADGNVVKDEEGNPLYEYVPVWEDSKAGFKGHEKEVADYYRRKSMDWFKDQTTGQILGMRTDFREPAVEHLLEEYLRGDESGDGTPGERRRAYEAERANIQSKYGDLSAKEAREKRSKDLTKLKRDLAGKQLRKVLGETGKLKQIFDTRRNGTAINAKDWFRAMVGLEDVESMQREVAKYENLRKKQLASEKVGADDSESVTGSKRIYDEEFKVNALAELDNLWRDATKEASAEEYYDETVGLIKKWFGDGGSLIQHDFEKYYEENKDNSLFEAYNLKKKLEELLEDSSKYPDA